MRLSITPFTVFALCSALICGIPASAQQSSPTMNQEPHHQRLTYIRHMRVFELKLAPGESTADYVLDHDGAILALTDATVRLHRGGAAGEPRPVAAGRADLG